MRLAPFAALSAGFPELDEKLRRFDALFDDACVGRAEATEALRDFWRALRRELDGETIARIREAYAERLHGRLISLKGSANLRFERRIAALAIYNAIFLES